MRMRSVASWRMLEEVDQQTQVAQPAPPTATPIPTHHPTPPPPSPTEALCQTPPPITPGGTHAMQGHTRYKHHGPMGEGWGWGDTGCAHHKED